MGSSTRDHILPTEKQLSKLLVVNKSHEKPWWDGCYRYVVPSSARELPDGSCECIPE